MTKMQLMAMKDKFKELNNFLKLIQNQLHVKNPDVVEEIRRNIECEIDRLIAWEEDEKK